MITWSVIIIFHVLKYNFKRILLSFVLYAAAYLFFRNNILSVSYLKLISLISFSLIMSGLILLDDISNLPLIRHIHFLQDFFLIGQLTSSFLPHLKKDILTAWRYLFSKYSMKVSKFKSLKMLLFALLMKIRNRKSELLIALLSRGYTIHGKRSFIYKSWRMKPEDVLPLSLGFLCLYQLNIL